MFSEYIKIAVANILNEASNGIQRACGSCNPSCDDLTRFICFGHTVKEVQDWIAANPEKLHKDYADQEDKLYAEYAQHMKQQDEEDKLAYSKQFCANCKKFIEAKNKALNEQNSVFDAVVDVELFQKECIKTCVKFNESFILHGRETLTDEEIFNL